MSRTDRPIFQQTNVRVHYRCLNTRHDPPKLTNFYRSHHSVEAARSAAMFGDPEMKRLQKYGQIIKLPGTVQIKDESGQLVAVAR